MESKLPNECPTCESEGTLEETRYNNEFMLVPKHEEAGLFTVCNLEGYKCSKCGEICIFPDQIRRNEKLIIRCREMHKELLMLVGTK